MLHWPLMALLITIGIAALVIWPIVVHPTLPPRQKRWIVAMVMLLLVPGTLAVYSAIGAPALGNL